MLDTTNSPPKGVFTFFHTQGETMTLSRKLAILRKELMILAESIETKRAEAEGVSGFDRLITDNEIMNMMGDIREIVKDIHEIEKKIKSESVYNQNHKQGEAMGQSTMYRLVSLNAWYDGRQFESLGAAIAEAKKAAAKGHIVDVWRDVNMKTSRAVWGIHDMTTGDYIR